MVLRYYLNSTLILRAISMLNDKKKSICMYYIISIPTVSIPITNSCLESSETKFDMYQWFM